MTADIHKTVFDAIVVGSGASGGWAAKRLSEAGLKVALVEAGRAHTDDDYREHRAPFELKYRDKVHAYLERTRPIQANAGCDEFNYDWFLKDRDEPYTTGKNKPFLWIGRTRITGGRTNVWGRQCYRLSDLDLKAASHDGYGTDWPLAHKDIAPYYDIVDQYVGITGNPEGLDHLPDGNLQPPMNMTCTEVLVRDRVKSKLGWTVTMGRAANLTRPLNGRAQCHYCGPCHHGCATRSYFNTAFTTVADAIASGNCTLISNALVYQVLMDRDRNRAQGVLYVDRETHQTREVQGCAVVMAAQALESVRVLLNSANSSYSNGLANSSGVLGRYLMDHVAVPAGAIGEFPGVGGRPSLGAPVRPNGIYVVRFRNTLKGPRSKNFIRGYGFQSGVETGFNWKAAGFGEAYKKALFEPVHTIALGAFGECLARHDNFVELDPNVKDIYGIPVLRIHMTYGENEHAMIDDMAVTAAQILEAAGAKNIIPFVAHDRAPGLGIHEVGIARMGSDPKTSVLNAFQQSHDIRNLFVVDGAGFTSSACQNPTLTIMALAVRSCDHLMKEMKRGDI
jgi:choline dehydrogenase-like flavoprotein